MRLVDRLLESARVYELWQAPFAARKFAPVAERIDSATVGRVLDVGCGPGTNRRHFRGVEYVGVDINPRYIRRARSRSGGVFVVGDASLLPIADSASFDLILVNSLLHHLPTPRVEGVLDRLAALLSSTGTLHVLDLVLPRRGLAARALAALDRGAYARPWEEWERILTTRYKPVVLESYSLNLLGLPLWHMIYFQGLSRR